MKLKMIKQTLPSLTRVASCSLAVFLVVGAQAAQAGAIHDAGSFATALPANDDDSTNLQPIGFDINFYGTTYSNLYVNNNGNVTFTNPLSTFTPFSLLSTGTPILAPFFADVDTSGVGSDITRYGQAILNGRNVFGVNWINVGYYDEQDDKLNSFQLIITDRSDIGVGDFDFEFNIDNILWETGDASGGTDGLGGNSARSGWSNGTTTSLELAGSAINGGLLNSNLSTGLIHNSLNSNILGQYMFQVRNGMIGDGPEPVPGGQVPEPASLALMGLGLAGLGFARRRKTAA